MKRQVNRIMIGAPSSGSGKTTITCALLSALTQRGVAVRAFKTGPDYIDPLFHRKAMGIVSENLDGYFLDTPGLKRMLLNSAEAEEVVCVAEGAMGLLDGLGGSTGEASAMDIACRLDMPIILVVDAKGMGRSILALLSGFLQYDPQKLIRGVILNRVGKGLFGLLSSMIEDELGLEVLGYFPENGKISLESRHLGLKLPGEIGNIREKIGLLAAAMEECVDLERLLAIARGASLMEEAGDEEAGYREKELFRLGIAEDEAFCFYYEDNKRMLEEQGAVLVPFSPLHDVCLPEGISGIWLGGGYPELYAGELAANKGMTESIRRAIEKGMPSVAECGGFMYLHEYIRGEDGKAYPLVGAVPGGCVNRGSLVRFGYIEIKEKSPVFLREGEGIRGHEFHYYDSDNNGESCLAVKPVSGRGWECVHACQGRWWGFPHLYFRSGPSYAERFAEACRKYSRRIEMQEGVRK